MFSPQVVFHLLLQKIERQRPHVAAALRAHQVDLMIVANVNARDEARIAALRRAGASTIHWALAEPLPTGPNIPAKRLRADIRLLHAAMALAEDLKKPLWYRELARATAHGIGLVIAAGLSAEQSPGGLDLYIWRACGTRSFPGLCDDALCRLCAEHDRARGAIQAEESRQNLQTFFGVAAVTLLTVGVFGAIAGAADRR